MGGDCFNLILNNIQNSKKMRNSRDISKEINLAQLKNHFNHLFETSPSEQQIYRAPLKEDIERIYSQQLIKNDQGQPFPLSASIEEFMKYGPGTFLLFKFLKLLTLVFGVMGLLSVVSLGILWTGTYYKDTHVQENTFATIMAMTTVGNLDPKFSTFLPFYYFVCLTIFTVAIIFWREREPYEVLACSKVSLLPSYYTVKLSQIPEGYTEAEMKDFLETMVGPVKEIYSVKEFKDDLFHYKELSQIIHQYKIERCKSKEEQGQSSRQSLLSLFHSFYLYYLKLKSEKKSKYQPVSAFITFQEVIDRQTLLQLYQEKPCLSKLCQKEAVDEDYLFKGQSLKFEPCNVEPNAISWENISIPPKNSCLRLCLQLILLSVVFFLGILIVYILALGQNNIQTTNHQITTMQQAIASGNEQTIKQYCINLSVPSFTSEEHCDQYTGLFIKVNVLLLLLPLLISFLKFLFVEILKLLVAVRRHSTQILKLHSQIVIAFIFYFAVIGISQLLIDIEVYPNVSVNNIFNQFAGEVYSLFPVASAPPEIDFSRHWFLSNSDKIMLIAILSFNFSSVIDIIYSVLRKAFIKYRASHQNTVAEMNDYLKCETLQIQFIYAFVLNIIFFTLLFGAVMPLLWVFGSVSFFLLFWVQKLIFVRYCQQPLIYSHSINHLVTRIILFGIVMASAVSPILLGGVTMPQSRLSDRYLSYMYYPILGVAILFYMFAKKYWLGCLKKVKSCIAKENPDRMPTIFSRISKPSKNLDSYSMHENPEYESVLKVLYTLNKAERLRQTFLIKKEISDYVSQDIQIQNAPFDQLYKYLKGRQFKNKKEEEKANIVFRIENASMLRSMKKVAIKHTVSEEQQSSDDSDEPQPEKKEEKEGEKEVQEGKEEEKDENTDRRLSFSEERKPREITLKVKKEANRSVNFAKGEDDE